MGIFHSAPDAAGTIMFCLFTLASWVLAYEGNPLTFVTLIAGTLMLVLL